mgnify:CR=1 FL=1
MDNKLHCIINDDMRELNIETVGVVLLLLVILALCGLAIMILDEAQNRK